MRLNFLSTFINISSSFLRTYKRVELNQIAFLFRLSVGIGLLVVICWSIDIKAVATKLTSISAVWITGLCIAGILHIALKAYKWSLLLRARGILLSVWQSTRLYLVGSLVGAFVPGGIGVDVYRITALSTFKKNRLVFSAVLLERIIGLAVISIFALLTLPFSMKYIGMNSMSIVWAIIAVTVVTIITLFISLQPEIVSRVNNRFSFLSRFRLWGKLYNLSLTFAEYRSHIGALLTFIMLTALEIVIIIFINFLASRSLAINISFVYLFCVIPLIQILIRLPISIQAVGIQEGLYVYFLLAAGFSVSDGFSVSILLRVAETFLIFLPAAIMLSVRPIRIHQLSEICDK